MSNENLDSTRDSITDWLYTLACGLMFGWVLYGLYIFARMLLEWAGVTW